MKHIDIELSVESVNKAVEELEKYKQEIEPKLDEVCRRLAEYGMTRAQAYYSQAIYDGIPDVSVTVEKRDKGYAVVASGSTVLFLEFGTGVHYPNDHPKAAELGVEHGSYGKGLGKNDYWFYTGQPGNAGGELAYGHKNSTITHGNPANMSLYRAGEDIRGEIKRVVMEVFGK